MGIKELTIAYLRASDAAAWETATDADRQAEEAAWEALSEAWGSEPGLPSHVRHAEVTWHWEED